MEETRYLISDAAAKVSVEAHVLRYWEEELGLPIPRTELGHRYYTEENIRTFQNIKELKERGFQLKAIKVLLPELNKRALKSLDEAEAMQTLEAKLVKPETEVPQPKNSTETPQEKSQKTISEKSQEQNRKNTSEKSQEQNQKTTSEKTQEQNQKSTSEKSQKKNQETTSENPPDEKEQILTGKDTKELLQLGVNLDRLASFESIMENVFRQTLQENNQELEDRISDSVLKGMDMLMQLREEKEEARYRQLDESIRAHQKKHKLVAAAKERTEDETRKKRFFFWGK